MWSIKSKLLLINTSCKSKYLKKCLQFISVKSDIVNAQDDWSGKTKMNISLIHVCKSKIFSCENQWSLLWQVIGINLFVSKHSTSFKIISMIDNWKQTLNQ